MVSARHNEMFAKQVAPDDLLDQAIEYIRTSLNPEDVFSKEELALWASENDYVKVSV